MAARLAPAGHYNAGSLAGDALHDLNTVDSRNAHVDAITDADRGVATGDDLENDNDPASAGVCELFSRPCNCQFFSFLCSLT